MRQVKSYRRLKEAAANICAPSNEPAGREFPQWGFLNRALAGCAIGVSLNTIDQ